MLRCIRFGEVLLDETFRTFLICNQCQTEFVEIPEFRVHLATSACGKRLFKDDVFALKFGAAQVTRGSKDKTYLLYNPADVQIATTEPVIHNTTSTPTDGGDDAYLDLIKIEEELLDPRWYTDIGNAEVESPQPTASLQTAEINNKPMEYKELVEAVGPYVQFKDGACKGKQNIVLRRFSNKFNKPVVSVPVASAAQPNPATTGTSPRNSILPAKRESNTDKLTARLLNPAAKRKLDLAPKQVHFKDEVNVKYVVNECSDNTANKRTRSLGNETNEKSSAGDGAILKRRKTITIPMDHINIHPDFQEQFGRGCSEVTKTAENMGANAAVIKKRIAQVNLNKTAKTNSLPNATSNTTISTSNATAKVAPNTKTAPMSDLQGKHKNLVPNPLVIQKQTNDTKNQTKIDLPVKNPITYSRSNLNCVKNEKILQSAKPMTTINTKAPTLVNKTDAPAVVRPQQRPLSTTTKPQPSSFAASNKKIPPALAPLSSNKISNPAALTAAKKPPTDAQKQTNDILNKLQTRGLQVKRTQPPMPPQAAVVIAAGEQQSKTMELLQKLQSKGMKVKILNGKEPTYAAGTAVTHTNVSINMPITEVNTKIMNNMGNVRNKATDIGTQNKTILNNKLIIKKVK